LPVAAFLTIVIEVELMSMNTMSDAYPQQQARHFHGIYLLTEALMKASLLGLFDSSSETAMTLKNIGNVDEAYILEKR
jgi:hypothetical protein